HYRLPLPLRNWKYPQVKAPAERHAVDRPLIRALIAAHQKRTGRHPGKLHVDAPSDMQREHTSWLGLGRRGQGRGLVWGLGGGGGRGGWGGAKGGASGRGAAGTAAGGTTVTGTVASAGCGWASRSANSAASRGRSSGSSSMHDSSRSSNPSSSSSPAIRLRH